LLYPLAVGRTINGGDGVKTHAVKPRSRAL
jgi:hypothetical protein